MTSSLEHTPDETTRHQEPSPANNGAPENGTTDETAPDALESAWADSGLRDMTTTLYDQSWTASLLRPTLITLLAVALVIALLAFIRRFAPGLPPIYTQLLIFLGIVTAVTGCVTTTWLAQPEQRGRRSTGYRAAEIILLLGVTRLTIWLFTGFPSGALILMRPLDALLDGYFLVGLFVILLAWVMATSMTDDLMSLALQPDDLYMTRTFNDRWQDTARPVYTDRAAILRRFTARWVVGGILLVILAAGSRFDLPQGGFFGIVRQNIDPMVILAIIVYFLVGLVLISQGQLALLRARWALQKTPSSESVLRNWPVYALIMIVAIGLFAALMPLGGTFWLAVVLSNILYFIYMGIFSIFRFVMGLFLLLLALLTGEETEQPQPEEPPMPQMTPEPLPPPTAEIPPWIGGAVFWVVIALLLGYAAYIYFSGKGFNFVWLQRVWQMLRARWDTLFGAYQTWQKTRRRAAAEQAEAQDGKRRRGLLSWLLPRNLDPDQQVRYYYLSTLEAAEEAGLPRRRGETPLQYAPRLATYMHAARAEPKDADADPTAEADANSTPDEPQARVPAQRSEEAAEINTLTAAFVRVRYAGAPADSEQMPRLKQIWEQLKRLLRA